MLCNVFQEKLNFVQVQEHAISSFAKSPTLPDIPNCWPADSLKRGMRIRSQGLQRFKHFDFPHGPNN